MKKTFILFFTTIGMLLTLVACTKDDSIENALLEVSGTSVELQADGETKSLHVVCDDAHWRVLYAANWLNVRRNGEMIEIKAGANPTVDERMCNVIIIARGVTAEINVSQRAAKGKGDFSQKDISTDQLSGSTVVDIVSNDPHWTATTDAEWITLTPRPYKYELQIDYSENTSRDSRTARILVKIGKVNKEIVVHQSGILFFLLPYIDFSGNIKDIKSFETKRHSEMLERYPQATDWNYNTLSPFFPRVRYFMKDARGSALEEAHIYAPDADVFKKYQPEFISFLEEQGFIRDSERSTFFFNKTLSVAAEINIMEAQHIAGIVFRYIAEQDKDYPTFTTFPSVPELQWGTTNEAIQQYEQNRGAKVNEKMTQINVPKQDFDMLAFTKENPKKEEPVATLYLTGHKNAKIFKEGLVIKDFFFKNTELAYYKSIAGDYFMTREFIALLKENGYVSDGQKNDYDIFRNDATNTILEVKVNAHMHNTLEMIFRRIDGINPTKTQKDIESLSVFNQ